MLTPGTRLGPYEVTGSLGKGGMGEVYRARDTRLERDVALKVLPDDVASDRDRMARFEREARLLAALNHPHIAAIYGIEDAGSTHALVMELAEGPTLSERIAEGPMPVDEAMDVARQMAEALEYAHERGIVHRDLKPANVKLTPEGEVKLLDFGLAKALEAEGTQPESDYSESPTISHQATQVGVILGTASYMAPEQARGKTVDRRADIWAFGVVFLEMLTGRKTFTGESLTDVLAAVVSREPDLSGLPSTTPPAVRRLLKRCLDKDPKRRLRDVGEARVLLEGHDPPAEDAGPPRQRPSLRVAAALALGLLALAGPLLFLWGRHTAPSSAEGIRTTRLTFRRGNVVDARFAPDGQTVIYAAAWGGALLELFSVRSDVRESRALGLRGAGLLSVSSTSELAVSLGYRNTIGFESTGTLARLPLGAGAPREVLENVQDADWSPDGRELAVVRDIGGKRRLEYPIGQALYETGGWLSSIRVSPDGSLVAFQDHPNRGDNVAVVSVVDRSGTVRSLNQPASNGVAWSPSGDEILAADAGMIRAVSLSGRSRVLYRELWTLRLLDISPEGRALVGRTHDRREIVSLAPGEAEERNLS
ncbi:MAG: protein kinase, partial [Vicinamibacteria bacterium]